MARCACLLLLGLALAACAGEGPRKPAERETPPRRAPEVASKPRPGKPAAGRWFSLARPPLAASRPVSVWTGSELFLWGADGDRGARFDPRAGTWRRARKSPLAARSSPAAVWTGREVLIWGGERRRPLADGAAYDPAANRWRRLAGAPLSPRVPLVGVWTGRELIVWGDADRGRSVRSGAAYDPARDSWRELPPAPLTLTDATATWTGDEVIVFGSRLDSNNHSSTRFAQGMAYDPDSKRWRRLPPSRLSPQASSIAWAGGEVLAWDYELRAATYDPSGGGWRALPRLPLESSECYPTSARLRERVLAWYCGQGALYDAAARRWRVVRPPRGARRPNGSPVAAGGTAYFAGATPEGDDNRLVAYRLSD